MPIETICSGCAKKLRVADEYAGRQARCPDCGTIYTVPAVVESSRSADEDIPLREPFTKPVEQSLPDRWVMKIDDGREFGPVDRAQLDRWFAERRIGPTTQIKREHDAQWQPARNLFPNLATVTTAVAGHTNPFAEQNPYASFTPGGVAASYLPPHRGGLILALALIGWFVGCFFLGSFAWVMATGDLAKMRAGQMDPSGEGLTRAGMIIGAIHTVLSLLVLMMVIALMVVSAVAGN